MHGERADEIRRYARKIAEARAGHVRPKRYSASGLMSGLADLKKRVAALGAADRSALLDQFKAERQALGVGEGIPISVENLYVLLESYRSLNPIPDNAEDILGFLLLIWLLDCVFSPLDVAQDLKYADEHTPFDLVDPDPAFWFPRIDTDGTVQFCGPQGYVVQTIPTVLPPASPKAELPYYNAEIHNTASAAIWPKNVNIALYPVDPLPQYFDPTLQQFWNILNDFFVNLPFLPSNAFAFSASIRVETLKRGSRGWGFWNLCSWPTLMQIAWFMQVDGTLPDGETPLVPIGFHAVVQNGLDVKFFKLPDLDEQWHDYEIKVTADRVEFFIDGRSVAVSDAADSNPVPTGPMSFEMWVDNAVYGGSALSWPQPTAAPRTNVACNLRVRSLPRATTAAGALAFFDKREILPHAQSQSQLVSFLSRNHPDYDLTAWCLFGSLNPDTQGGRDEDMIALASIIQYLRLPSIPGSKSDNPLAGKSVFMAGIPYCSSTTDGYELLGTVGVLPSSTIQVASDPWSIVVTYGTLERQMSTICYSLVSGTMGEANAEYRVTGDVFTQDESGAFSPNSKRVKLDIHLKDRLGVVSQGHGSASFCLEWLTDAQNKSLMTTYNGSVADFLDNSGERMTGQGSHYLSFPLLEVTSLRLEKEGETTLTGSSGTLWCDFVVQGYDSAGWRRVSDAHWLFFAIQMPASYGEPEEAYMISQTETVGYPSQIKIANHFSKSGAKLPNSAYAAAHTWPIGDIEIIPDESSVWIAPSGTPYYLKFDIMLKGDTHNCSFELEAIRKDQEIRPPALAGGAKYEGLFKVTRTRETNLGKITREGIAYVEMH